MSVFLFANDAASTLAAPISNVATTVNLSSGTGALFPNPSAGQQFALTFNDAATGLLTEIVYCTARTGDALTIARAQEGTVAQSWLAGDLAANLVTAGQMAAMQQSAIVYPARIVTASGAFVMTTADATGGVGLNRTSSLGVSSTTLPSGATAGQLYAIEDLNNNFQAYPVTVNAPGGMTIDGLASVVMSVNGQCGYFRYYGSNIWSYFQIPATRTLLNANTTYYVATTGSDSTGNGSVGSPWATIQHASDFLQQQVDLGGYVATIQFANGTYSAGLVVNGPYVGAAGPASVVFRGDPTTPANVIISTASTCLYVKNGAVATFTGFKMISSGGRGIFAENGGNVFFGNMNFGACSSDHMSASEGGIITATAAYTISGNSGTHARSQYSSSIVFSGLTITLTGTPAFANAFAFASTLGAINGSSNVFSGSASGPRYSAGLNAVIDSAGGGANYFPGNSAGSTSTGGQYN